MQPFNNSHIHKDNACVTVKEIILPFAYNMSKSKISNRVATECMMEISWQNVELFGMNM